MCLENSSVLEAKGWSLEDVRIWQIHIIKQTNKVFTCGSVLQRFILCFRFLSIVACGKNSLFRQILYEKFFNTVTHYFSPQEGQ